MSSQPPERGVRSPAFIRVWDIPARLFHWLMVLAVAVAAVTGFFGPEWMLDLHIWAGYGVAALLLFRLVWAFFGSEYSRYDRLELSPRAVIAHLRRLATGQSVHRIGHNPAGSAMIVGLVLMLAAIAATGLVALGGEEKQGVLAGIVPYTVGHAAREVHELLTIALLAMIALHVAAVIVDSIRGPVNLVGAMITGRKRWRLAADTSIRRARPVAAASTLAIAGAAVAGSAGFLSEMPPLGVHALTPSPVYEAECGACHYDFHPSLLPRSSWTAIVSDLADHFGEDASLDSATRDRIGGWLAANAAERWDTEAANNFRHVSADEPLRITATKYWKRRHREIPETVFASRPVGSKVNCIACHRDARSGRFDDQSIAIPKEAK